MLGALNPRVENGLLSARLIETRFSAFLAWRDWGFADRTYFNIFGSAVIAGNDGGYIFGIMGAHTSNAGAVYPCSGSLEPADVGIDGRVDIWAQAARELYEETGLLAGEARPDGDFLVRSGQLLSVTRVYRFDLPARDLAQRIEKNLDVQEERELEGVAVFHAPSDLDLDELRPYAAATVRHLFGDETERRTGREQGV